MLKRRAGFSIIELIFVIVIVGILASLAFNKFFAIRDDTKLMKDISTMSSCILEAGAYYTAQGTDMPQGYSQNCDRVKCYTIRYGSATRNFSVTTNPSGASFCGRIDELGGHLAKTYNFKGTRIRI